MNKNTVWAIILSTLVIFLSYFILPLVFPSLRPITNTFPQISSEAENVQEENDENNLDELELGLAEAREAADVIDESLSEVTFTIKTDKAEVVLTNRGGDIIS